MVNIATDLVLTGGGGVTIEINRIMTDYNGALRKLNRKLRWRVTGVCVCTQMHTRVLSNKTREVAG